MVYGPKMGAARRLMEKMDERGGLARHSSRIGFGIAKSLKDTASSRSITTVRWFPGRDVWSHRWPEGRVVDAKRWRSPLDWATLGGNYDMTDLLWCHYRPQLGDTVVDVGAGHGGETFFLASLVGSQGRVLAVEAAPTPFRQLQTLVALNGWSHVEPLQVALADAPGTLTISNEEDNWVEGNVYGDSGGVSVAAVTFDALCAERGIVEVDWVKMNIEGAEKDALRGMERMAPHVQHMTISCHDFLGTEWGRSKDYVLAWLTSHGFSVRVRGTGEGWEANYVYAWRE